MKKYLLSFTVVTMLGMGYSLTNNQGNLYSSSTGAPGAGSCAVGGCHGGSAQTSEHVTLTFLDASQNPVTTYVAGQTYTVIATAHAALTNAKFGFALSANGGTLSESSPNIQKVSNYLTHTAAGTTADVSGGKAWTATWTAPASGNVNFQLYLNATNNDNGSGGDVIYSRSAVLSQASGINDLVNEASFAVYPVPSKDLVNIDFVLRKASAINLTVIGHDGKLVKTIASEHLNSGPQHFELAEELASGMYFVKITANDQHMTKKILVQ